MSVFVGGGGLSLLDQFNLQYSDDSIVDVQVNSTTPVILAKWKIVFSDNALHFNLQAMMESINAFFNSVSGASNGCVIEEESSIDDITYTRDLQIQQDATAYAGTCTSAIIISGGNSATNTIYIRLIAYNQLATDHYQLSKKRFQMIGMGLYDGVITRLI